MDMILAECGNSYFDWYANGCQYGGDPMDMCQTCTEWEHIEEGN